MEKQEIKIYCTFQKEKESFQELLEKIFMEYLQEENV